MTQKEVSIEDYTIDRKYNSRITLEEFVLRMIRSHAETKKSASDAEKGENQGNAGKTRS